MAIYDGNKFSGLKVVNSSLKPLTVTKNTLRILITKNTVVNALKTTQNIIKNNYKFSIFTNKFTNGRYLASIVLRQGSPVVKLALVKNGNTKTTGLKNVSGVGSTGNGNSNTPTRKIIGQLFPRGLSK